MSRSDSALPSSRFYARTFAVVTALALGYFLFRILLPFFVPILWGALLALMFQPLYGWLLAKWHRPGLAAGLVTLVVAVTILLPFAFFLTVFVRQATDLLGRFQAEAHDRKLPALQLVLELHPVQALIEQVGAFTSLSKQQILDRASEAAQEALQVMASTGGALVLGAFSIVATFFLTMFLLFFFVRDGGEMLRRATHLVPMSEERKEELRLHLGAVTQAVVLGTMVTALVQGTLLGIGFAIAGLPSPVVFGSLAALSSLVPVVGTALVWLPAVVTLVAQGSTGMAVFLLVWCLVLVVSSDNVIRPMIISGRTNVSTLLIVVGVMGGVSAFGFTGLFAGPVLLTLVAALLRYADESRMGTIPMPSAPTGLPPPAAAAPPDAQAPPPVRE